METALVQSVLNSLSPESTAEQAAEIKMKVERLIEIAMEAKCQLAAQLLEWCEANGDLTIGDMRYYAGSEKQVDAVNDLAVMDALLEMKGGDVGAVVGCLRSAPWKYGMIRSLLEECGRPEKFDELFTTTMKSDLRTGKPLRKVLSVNTNFVK